MFIPIGLIGRLVSDARDHEQYAAMHHAGLVHEQEKMNQRAHAMWQACAGADACLLVLGSTDWPATAVDQATIAGPPVTTPSGGWRDAGDGLGPGPHGFLGICPGRHMVATMVMGRTVHTSFVLFPREAFFLRLDYATGAWLRFAPAEERAILERAGRADLGLFDYGQMVVARRLQANAIRSTEEALGDCLMHVKDALQAIALNDARRTAHRGELASAALLGAPVRSFEPITTLLGFHAFELAGKNRMRDAHAVLTFGLGVLPEHPTLMGVVGELLLREGKTAEGRPYLERALAREAGLDDRLRSRVRELLG